MSNRKSELKRMCMMNPLEMAEQLSKLQAELESLKRERAMLADALKFCESTLVEVSPCMDAHCKQSQSEFLDLCKRKVTQALSATEPQATQWLNDKLSAATEELRKKLAEQQAMFERYGGKAVVDLARQEGYEQGYKQGKKDSDDYWNP